MTDINYREFQNGRWYTRTCSISTPRDSRPTEWQFSQLGRKGNVWRSVWRICRSILRLKYTWLCLSLHCVTKVWRTMGFNFNLNLSSNHANSTLKQFGHVRPLISWYWTLLSENLKTHSLGGCWHKSCRLGDLLSPKQTYCPAFQLFQPMSLERTRL